MTEFPKMDILYPCSLCSTTFVLKKKFLMHMKTSHQSCPTQHNRRDKLNDVQSIDFKSLFACSFCSRPFSSKGLLKTHMYLKHKVPIQNLTSQLMDKSTVSHKINYHLFLNDLLPDNYTYKILTFNDLLCGHFKARFEISNMDNESFSEWLYRLCYKSKVHYTCKMLPSNSSKEIFRNVYKCKSIEYWDKCTNSILLKKTTYCKASLSVVIKQIVRQKNAMILINHCHYHPMNHFTLLTVNPDIRVVYYQLASLLYNECTAAHVLYNYKMQIIQNQGKEHFLNSINTRDKPDVEFVYDMYYMINGKSGFPSPYIKRLESLIKSVSYYNDCQGKERAAIKLVENDIVLAIRTPLKEITNTDMIFVCSTNFMFCKTWFMFSKNDKEISIPVGIIIATKDNECMLKTGLILWKELGGIVKTVMVEFIHTLTFQSVFPNANIYISKFHFLLSVWKWLFNSTDNCIDDKLNYFVDLKKKMCSENVAKGNFDINLALGLIETCPHFNQFIQNILESKFLVCSPPITNPCTIFGRNLIYYHTKSFSILQMFHFVIDEIDLFYDTSTNGPNNLQITFNDLDEADEKEDNFTYFCFADKCSMYLVISDEDKFFVDMDIGLCSCTINNNYMCFNDPCIHQIFLNNKPLDLGDEITENKEFENILSEFRYINNKIREQFITDPDYFKSSIQSYVSELTNNLKSDKSLL